MRLFTKISFDRRSRQAQLGLLVMTAWLEAAGDNVRLR